MTRVCKILSVLSSAPTAAALPAGVLIVRWLRPAAALLRVEEFLQRTEGCSDERHLSEEVSFEYGEGNDTQEQGNKGGQFQLDEGQNG